MTPAHFFSPKPHGTVRRTSGGLKTAGAAARVMTNDRVSAKGKKCCFARLGNGIIVPWAELWPA